MFTENQGIPVFHWLLLDSYGVAKISCGILLRSGNHTKTLLECGNLLWNGV